MEKGTKPPRKKGNRPQAPEHIKGRQPGDHSAPAAAERTDAERTPAGEGNSALQSTSPEHTPVTNQDEQEKVTNADEGDIAVNEK